MRPSELLPKVVIDELTRLNSLPGGVAAVRADASGSWDGGTYSCKWLHPTWLKGVARNANEVLELYATARWLAEGPKCFYPSSEQVEALRHVEIPIAFDDYRQPFPSLLVCGINVGPFHSVLCHQHEKVLVFGLYSHEHLNDVVIVARYGTPCLETVLNKYDPDCESTSESASQALRVALNCCLLLANHGCKTSPMYPKEVASDQSLARERTERGERARRRLHLAVQRVAFDQEVEFYDEQRVARDPRSATGSAVTTHWRRGHWAKQPCGKGLTERKLIFRKPILVRADLFVGAQSQSSVTYRG